MNVQAAPADTRRPAAASVALTAMAAGTAGGLLAPWPAAAFLLIVAFLVLRRGRLALLSFAALAVLIQTVLFGFLVGRGAPLALGPVDMYPEGAMLGATGALRLAAILAVNLAVLDRMSAPRILDGVWLPVRARAFLGAVLIAMQDLQDEGRRLVTARRIEGAWPHGSWRKVRAAATLVPAVLVAAQRRGRTRHEALRSAGIHVGRTFAPLVAVTALALAGRIVFAPVPNIAPTYLFVFLGGMLFGPRVGALAGGLSMALSNLLLSGLLLPAYVNVPAMAALGIFGGWTARWTHGVARASRAQGLLAGAFGLAATLLFSVLSDLATWALVPEFRGTFDTLRVLVLAGLVFNVVPAVANAFLFAWSVGPVAAAREALVVPQRSNVPDAQPRTS